MLGLNLRTYAARQRFVYTKLDLRKRKRKREKPFHKYKVLRWHL